MTEARHRLHPKYAKRHYEDFAAILAELRRCSYGRRAIDAIESELVRLFGRDNPRFSAARFVDACQPIDKAMREFTADAIARTAHRVNET